MAHEDETHGTAPLPGVDPAPLHAAVDALAAALHDYVGTAVGARTEFGAAESDEDPRVLALENRIGQLNAHLFDVMHETLGIHPDLTSSVWGSGDQEDGRGADAQPERANDAEAFYLGFLVAAPHSDADMTLDGVIGLLDEAGEQVMGRLAGGGYQTVEWAASRGIAPGFDGEFDSDFDIDSDFDGDFENGPESDPDSDFDSGFDSGFERDFESGLESGLESDFGGEENP